MGPVGGSVELVPMGLVRASRHQNRVRILARSCFLLLLLTTASTIHYLTAAPALQCRGCFRAARREDYGPWLGTRSGKPVPGNVRDWESAAVTCLCCICNEFDVL